LEIERKTEASKEGKREGGREGGKKISETRKIDKKNK
jgi:hypothetical protein